MADGQTLTVAGIELEVLRRGEGRPLVLLHGFQTVDPTAPFLDRLAAQVEVIAPSAPGFGASPRPADFDTVYDLVHLYRILLDDIPGERVDLIGFSFGGWLAAEVAALRPPRLGRLVLVDPLGVKLSGPEVPDILDIFNRSPAEVARRSWHDPVRFAPDFEAMDDAALVRYAQNREALCRYAWHPYMYNPQLKRWLGQIRAPALVLWGESDGIATPDYGRSYAGLIPGAQFALIAGAGHHPEIEQPKAFAEQVLGFL